MIETDKKINILMMIDSLGIGGAEIAIKNLSSGMARMGHNVVVLVIRDDIVIDMDEGVNVEIFGYKKIRHLPSDYINSIRLRKFIGHLEKKYGDFHLKTANLTLSHKLAHLAKLHNIYYCIHENVVVSNLDKRSGLRRFAREVRMRRLFFKKDIIAVSRGIMDSLESIRGIHFKSVRNIYNPINTEVIIKLSKEHNPYNKLEYIVHVGRMSSEKRHDVLLDAYKKSRLTYKLVLVGDGQEKNSITTMVHQMELDDDVVMAGFINNPYPIIRGAKILVLSSEYEGFGMVLAEALCIGTAVVSADSKSGPGEILVSRLSNYLAPVGDAAMLAEKMNKAVKDVVDGVYPFQCAQLERFSLDTVIKQYVELID